MTTAKATTALALLLCFSCSRSPRVVVDMYDGFEFAGQRLVPVAATTFVVALIDPDDSKVLYEFTILDHQVRPLPLTVRDISGVRTNVRPAPQVRTPFRAGAFSVIKALPGNAFEVQFDVEAGVGRVVARGVAHPASTTRPEVWPYDTRPPKPGIVRRIVSALGL